MNIGNCFKRIKVGEPLFLRNMLIVPLTDGRKKGDYNILDEALSGEEAEVLDSGVIKEAILKYDGALPLFILDGEEIVGALQNRVVNTAILARPKTETKIPVTCVEEGRWNGDRAFKPSFSSAYPTLRAILASSVTESLFETGTYHANQDMVWDSVSEKLTSLKVSSMTNSMHDLYNKLEDEVDRYLEGMDLDENTVGFIASAGDEILGLDLFGSPQLFSKLKRKLIRSYALDALERIRRVTPLRDVDFLSEFIESLKELDFETFPSPSMGKELRARNDRIVARALTYRRSIIHLSAFPVPS
jgi:hypothetical protein